MNTISKLFTGLAITLSGVALTMLTIGGLTAHYPDYTLVRQVAMGWPLILMGVIVCAIGLRVATWPETAETETTESVESGTTFKAAA